jgi:hypothetical protein
MPYPQRTRTSAGDKITGVAKLGVYIIVLGVASQPLGMPIEIELVFEIAA